MIWIRSLPRKKGEGLFKLMDRALAWLLVQTCVFGISTAVLMTLVSNYYPHSSLVDDMVFLSLLGFGGGFCGTVILFYLISATSPTEN